ncbi:DNA-processing protein DprA [bacterium]|nr:DNA-processing protein DprA [bacterium]
MGKFRNYYVMNVSEETLVSALALLSVRGLGIIRLRRLLVEFGSPDGVISADVELLSQSVGDTVAKRIKRSIDNPILEKMVKKIRQSNANTLIWGQPGYPNHLKSIPKAPPILFVIGEILPQDSRAVAVVGTRRPTHNGKIAATRISKELASAGITIVSGLAVGIDGYAHRAALDAGGRTIAVLASGPDIIYPPEHRALAGKIIENGALISEFLPGTPPEGFNFPRRNRIISGISLGVLVVEAGERSGALITADHAAEQGREVFAVPGPPSSPQSRGTNKLIKNGARLTTSAQDIIEALELPTLSPEKLDMVMEKVEKLTGAAKILFEELSSEPVHINDLARKCKMDVSYALPVLSTLEFEGLVMRLPGMRFVKNI